MGRFLTPLSKNGKLVKTVPITNGGTSATTAPLALSNLGGIVDSETNVPDGVVKLDTTGHIPIGLIDPSVLREISVKGPIQMKMNSTKTFQITDFDSFIDVDITTDLGSGTAVLNNDIITYTAPSSIGTYGFYRNGKLFPIDVTSNNYLQTNLLVPFGDALNVPNGLSQAGAYALYTSFDIDYLGQSLVVNYVDSIYPGDIATYTYEKIGGIWTQKQAFAYMNFYNVAGSIAISGDGNVFSSKGKDISNSYVITIFRKIAGSWVLENEIPDVLSVYSGHSLSYDGSVLAYYDYNYRTLSIYEYVSGTWTLLFTYIDPDTPISGTTNVSKNVAVSYNGIYVAYCNAFNQKVHVFKKDLGVWNHQQTILNVDELGNPHTAYSVKFSKNNLMLIAGTRSCVLYNLNSNTWVLNYDLANIEYSPGNKLYQHSGFITFTPSSISKDTEDLIIAGNFTLAFINGLWTVTSTTTDFGMTDISIGNIELNGNGTSYFNVRAADPLSGIAVFE